MTIDLLPIYDNRTERRQGSGEQTLLKEDREAGKGDSAVVDHEWCA